VTDDQQQRRRSSDRQFAEFDKRLTLLERDVRSVLEAVPSIHNKLDSIRSDMAEPQSSPLGRSLLERAVRNSAAIEALADRHDRDLQALNAWRSEMIGAAKFSRIIQLGLGIAIAIITLLQVAERPT
jgi:hypothetical protein